MASILISGPAGASKSALEKKILAELPLAIAADFQSIYGGQLRKRKKSYAKRSCSQTGRLQILASKSNRLSDF